MSSVLALPEVRLQADGVSLGSEMVHALTAVRVQQRLSQPSQCELIFCDPPGPLTVVDVLRPGAALQVGVRDHQAALFKGQVTAVEHVYEPGNAREVRVRGYDLLHRLRKRQRVQAHVHVTPRSLAEELVADLGLSVQAAESGPTRQRLMQHRQSDLELLTDLSADCGLYLTIRDDVLHLLTLEGLAEEQPLPLALGETLLEARIEINADTACDSVKATGWDPSRVETHAGTASSARVGRQVRTDVTPADVGGDDRRDLVDELAPSDTHAEAYAQAMLDARVGRTVSLWGVADGDPCFRVGSRVVVSGVADALAGRYVLTEVTHTIDARSGFVSELSSAAPPPRSRQGSAAMTFGVVTRVDDPDGLGRVRVSLPTYGDVETEWMGVVCPGAGPHKGLVVLPDVHDKVLVLLPHADPGEGVVIGGLFGGQRPPDTGVEGSSVQRFTLHTPGGQYIRFDDAQNVIHLEDHAGSFLELGPNRVRIHAAVDLQLEAPGRSVVIRGNSIDFERA